MSTEIKVPELPESIADAVVVDWYKKPGEWIQQGDTLVDLETDKVVLEVPATVSGEIEKIAFAEGAVVTAGQVLAVLDESIQTEEAATVTKKTAPAASQATVTKKTGAPEAAAELAIEEDAAEAEVAISPSARKIMREQGITADMIAGSGKHGRILKED
ncbi:MAG: E3 binding domain-containing protein, partial [Gammaproteobacteria bacterium]|nr:E3 binding domain-containing protein [Gammaproteobacteria bacterium]